MNCSIVFYDNFLMSVQMCCFVIFRLPKAIFSLIDSSKRTTEHLFTEWLQVRFDAFVVVF